MVEITHKANWYIAKAKQSLEQYSSARLEHPDIVRPLGSLGGEIAKVTAENPDVSLSEIRDSLINNRVPAIIHKESENKDETESEGGYSSNYIEVRAGNCCEDCITIAPVTNQEQAIVCSRCGSPVDLSRDNYVF